MFYTIRHTTKFKYGAPINENVMEVRMQPRNDEWQQCSNFQLHIRPHTRVFSYQDYLNNTIHHFNIPGLHTELVITAEAVVSVTPPPALPEALPTAHWDALEALKANAEYWEMSTPSTLTGPSPALQTLSTELDVTRRADPLSMLYHLNSAIYYAFTYATNATRVDSPIEEAIEKRSGVCQDYTHIMLALLRNYLSIPCRYVSGYLYHNRSDQSASSATHAWVEAFLPDLGWVGFDPTNNVLAGERHIRAAIGRDYADVPPTRGIFKGKTDSELSVHVQVRKTEEPTLAEETERDLPTPVVMPAIFSYATAPTIEQQQQQQQ